MHTAAGFVAELAQLGRSLMREAYQHDWDAGIQAECGWSDEGQGMIELALSSPDQARQSWSHLLETDGNRSH